MPRGREENWLVWGRSRSSGWLRIKRNIREDMEFEYLCAPVTHYASLTLSLVLPCCLVALHCIVALLHDFEIASEHH